MSRYVTGGQDLGVHSAAGAHRCGETRRASPRFDHRRGNGPGLRVRSGRGSPACANITCAWSADTGFGRYGPRLGPLSEARARLMPHSAGAGRTVRGRVAYDVHREKSPVVIDDACLQPVVSQHRPPTEHASRAAACTQTRAAGHTCERLHRGAGSDLRLLREDLGGCLGPHEGVRECVGSPPAKRGLHPSCARRCRPSGAGLTRGSYRPRRSSVASTMSVHGARRTRPGMIPCHAPRPSS